MAVQAIQSEVDLVQNTAFGAVLIWRFGLGFQEESRSVPPLLLHCFLVLPICLHQETLDLVSSTQRSSGLALFASKIAQIKENLLAIHLRALSMRQLTLESLGVGETSRLLTVDYESARVAANTMAAPQIPERIKEHMSGAAKLGSWCARLPLDQVATLLKVDF